MPVATESRLRYKGQGKYGSLGTPLPLPVAESRSDDVATGSRPDEQASQIPKPLPAYSPEEIEAQFGPDEDDYYRIFPEGFWNGKNIRDVRNGARVLWKGIKKGKSGGESTKEEYFSGLVHGWQDHDFVIVS